MFSGNTSSAAGDAVYIEDVFSTYLYTGTGANRSIDNGIDLSTKGGMVWIKGRNIAFDNNVFDTARGPLYDIFTNTTASSAFKDLTLTSFNTNGFSLGSDGGAYGVNYSPYNYVSWTFRKQPKFFDIVTYTGTGANRTISHSLGSTPACIIVKRTDTTSNWQVYHNGLTSAAYSIQLDLTNAQASAPTVWNSTAPTSTVFSVGTSTDVNASGGTYVAYIYAHNAGGFGLTGTDNVISCGSYTGNGSANGPVITLGYEPQWVLIKNTSSAASWVLQDNMRGMAVTSSNVLTPNTTAAESTLTSPVILNATGFQIGNASYATYNNSGETYIYIAIRKGPMKVPTDATKVFAQDTTTTATTNFPVDLYFNPFNSGSSYNVVTVDRLRGGVNFLSTSSSAAENQLGTASNFASNTSITATFGGGFIHALRRAPNFFDQVCFTATASTNQRVTHNLGVAPDLIIVKARSAANFWIAYVSTSALSTAGRSKWFVFSGTNAMLSTTDAWGSSDPTATDFGINQSVFSTGVGEKDVAYLFASCLGVSKVGSYTGTGTLTTINCGFTGGARFVLIKRTDTTGNWFVWNTARGMTAGTDPSMSWNTTGAESNANSVYTATTGFQLLASPSADVNTNGGTYIYLAIA